MALPRVSNPAAEFLADAGRFLYGDNGWLGPLAEDLGVKPNMLSNWLKGKSKLRGDHPAVQRALGLVVRRLQNQEEGWRARCEGLAEATRPSTPLARPR